MATGQSKRANLTPNDLLEPTEEDEEAIEKVVSIIHQELRSRRNEYAENFKLSVDAKLFGASLIVAEESVRRFIRAGWQVTRQPGGLKRPTSYIFSEPDPPSSDDR